MKFRFSSVALLAVMCSWMQLSVAAPAVPQLLYFKDTSGQTFAGHLKGDEWLSWVETSSGHVAVRTPGGHYQLARLKNGRLEATGQAVAATPGTASGSLRANDPAFRAFLKSRPQPGHVQSTLAPSASVQAAAGSGPLQPGQGRNRGPNSVWNDLVAPPSSIPLLVVILEFNDQHLRSPVSTWQQKIFGTAPGQMNNFYSAVSQGRFQFTPARETQGSVNDGIMKVALSMNHPNLGTAIGTTERYLALDQLDGYIDFASYDSNGDHVLQKEELQIIYLYSGGESATGSSLPSVWAHKTTDIGVFHDGVELRNNYARFGERHFSPPNDNDATIGIIAHELGHAAFNLPDLYDYDGSSSGTGPFCLMSYGSWGAAAGEAQGASPSPLSAWPRYRLGFATVNDVVAGTPLRQSLLPLSSAGGITLIPSDEEQEFFLVENRYPVGLDISLATTGSGGLMVWHIDETQWSNSNDSIRLVDYEADDALGQFYWPYTGRAVFNNGSTPNSRSNGGASTGVSVSDISIAADATHTASFLAEKRTPTIYPSMNFRGTPNGWAAAPMTAVAANTWETTQTFAAGVSNARFKFDVYGNWATNFGDTNRDGVLEPAGADIPAPASAGSYRVRLNENTMSYTLTRVNQQPLANAGPDQIVLVNQTVTLDGSGSSDADGSIVSYQWSNGLSGVRPSTSFSTPGTYIISLTVSDNQGASARDDVLIDVRSTLPNQLPTARIAPLTGASVGQTVSFDGSASSDPDGQISSYSWSISGVPGTLSGARPSFTFTAAGTYTVSLTVTDNSGGQNTSSISVVVGSTFDKVYPQVLYRGTSNNWVNTTPMLLTANNTWTLTVTVPSSGTQSFKFDIHGDWRLNFGDNNADGIADQGGGNIVLPAGGGSFVISFNDATRRYTVLRQGGNQLPVAVVPAPQSISGAGTVSLNGSGSYDPDGQISAYQWTQTAGPAVTIANPNQAIASVALPAASTSTVYRFSLRVSDNSGATASAEQSITVNPVQSCTPAYARMQLRGTSNAWGSTAMTLASDCFWEATASFGSSSSERFKFDVNGDWAINFGDSNADGSADQGGADIRITQGAGSYRIRFNDVSKRYTISRQ